VDSVGDDVMSLFRLVDDILTNGWRVSMNLQARKRRMPRSTFSKILENVVMFDVAMEQLSLW
jgi:hypothetical protein